MNKIFNKSLTYNIDLFKKEFKDDDSIVYRLFQNEGSKKKFCLIYVKSMVNDEVMSDNIFKPIMSADIKRHENSTEFMDYVVNKIVSINEVEKSSDFTTLVENLYIGKSILFIDGFAKGAILNTLDWSSRSINEPISETIIKGPREGFNEVIYTNISLIRRRIVSQHLKVKFREIGNITKTKVCICYIEEIAKDEIVKEVERRLDKIDIDGILDTGYIEEFITDEPISLFKTLFSTEKPDTVCGKLLEGRVAIICNGSPSVITTPFVFIEYFQVDEDYYQQYYFATFNRMLRYLAFFLTTSVPAIYIALTNYHQELIPTPLILSIFEARQGIPFPSFLEAFIMIIVFELIRESGIRISKYSGSAISIVGALVVGEAAVQARLVSQPMIIVIGITGIANFLLPKMANSTIFIRIIFLFLASILGLYGYIFGVIFLSLHLFSIRSFGIPYMLNVDSMEDAINMKDAYIRAPWWYMDMRGKLISKKRNRKKNIAKN
ncbi:spore germination protein [Vallitalea guaymasensis]|uniref:Spore germination protein n=1 Tax=Vallitalea guaymasensis TaxID=1185412 RepID=A0A8J8SDH8_9FIRM|nr:spore germination protein [Vallitalea guaymasensis]QUH30491.1 spore germination protein [Vallitalea guaymasensis]